MSKIKIAIGLCLAAVLLIGGVASGEVFQKGNLVLTAGGSVQPKKLPKKRRKPVKLNVSGKIRTKDGSTPPISRKAVIDFDKQGAIYTKGKPKCNPKKLVDRRTKQALKRCRKSLIGKGKTKALVDFPDQDPFVAKGPLLAFLGPKIHGHKSIILHVFANVPAPTAFVVPVLISKHAPGRRYGLRTVTKIPTISGGNGRLISFKLHLNKKWRHKGKVRRFAMAKCRNGRFAARAKIKFQGAPNVTGSLVRPCKTKRRHHHGHHHRRHRRHRHHH